MVAQQGAERVSRTEWSARVDLAAAFRLLAQFGWDDLIYSRISARIPDRPDRFLLNPFGLLFEEVTASSLIRVDIQGNPDEPTDEEVNPGGFIPLAAIHAARPEVMCVIHTHTVDGIAVACQAGGLLPVSQSAALIAGGVAYHDYEGIPLTEAEKARIVAKLGNGNAMILRNHGLMTCGRSVQEAFLLMHRLETACRIQLKAQSGGAGLLPIPADIRERSLEARKTNVLGEPARELAWKALLRKLDLTMPGYAN